VSAAQRVASRHSCLMMLAAVSLGSSSPLGVGRLLIILVRNISPACWLGMAGLGSAVKRKISLPISLHQAAAAARLLPVMFFHCLFLFLHALECGEGRSILPPDAPGAVCCCSVVCGAVAYSAVWYAQGLCSTAPMEGSRAAPYSCSAAGLYSPSAPPPTAALV